MKAAQAADVEARQQKLDKRLQAASERRSASIDSPSIGPHSPPRVRRTRVGSADIDEARQSASRLQMLAVPRAVLFDENDINEKLETAEALRQDHLQRTQQRVQAQREAREAKVQALKEKEEADRSRKEAKLEEAHELAAERRERQLEERRAKAQQHADHVLERARSVRAAKTMQSWWRDMGPNASTSSTSPSSTNATPPIMQLAPSAAPAAPQLSSQASLAAIKSVRKAIRLMKKPSTLRAAKTLFVLLNGNNAAGINIDDASIPPPNSIAVAEGDSGPFANFEACARGLHDGGQLAAAQFLIKLLPAIWNAVKEAVPTPPPTSAERRAALGAGDVSGLPDNTLIAQAVDSHQPITEDDGEEAVGTTDSDTAVDAAEMADAGLRPTIARSQRTFLAAFMIAYFPAEILPHLQQAGGAAEREESEEAAQARSAVEAALVVRSRAFLAALRQGCEAVFDLYRSSSELAAITESGPLDPNQQQIRRAQLRGYVEAMLRTNATWCEYMDQFMVWKQGDGARLAQQLAGAYRELLITKRRYELQREANSAAHTGPQLHDAVTGEALPSAQASGSSSASSDAGSAKPGKGASGTAAGDSGEADGAEDDYEEHNHGFEQLLAAVTSQTASMERQVTQLMGAEGAKRWQQEQEAAIESAIKAEEARHAEKMKAMSEQAAAAPAASTSAQGSQAKSGSGSAKPGSGPAPAAASYSEVEDNMTSADEDSPRRTPRRVAASPKMQFVKEVFSNQVLAHELMLQPNFHLPEPDMSDDIALRTPVTKEQDMEQAAQAKAAAEYLHAQQASAAATASPSRSSSGGLGSLNAAGASPSRTPGSSAIAPSPALLAFSPASGPAQSMMSVMPPLSLDGMEAIPDVTQTAAPTTDKGTAYFWRTALHLALARGLPSNAVVAQNDDGRGVSPAIVNALQNGLESIGSGLEALVPHREDFHRRFRAEFNVQTYVDIMRVGEFTPAMWQEMAQYLVGRIRGLEAPSRSSHTDDWLEAFERRVAGWVERDGHSASPSASDRAQQDQFVLDVVPQLLGWLVFKLGQIKLDIANFHLSTLAPYLIRTGKGAEYERKSFDDSLAKGDISLRHMTAWVTQTLSLTRKQLPATLSTEITAGVAETVVSRSLDAVWHGFVRDLQTDLMYARLCMLREGILALLTYPYSMLQLANPLFHMARHARQTSDPSLSDENTLGLTGLPETLLLDAHRITDLQNEFQRVVLQLTLAGLAEEALRTAPHDPAGATATSSTTEDSTAPSLRTTADLHRELAGWLSHDDTRMDHVVVGVVDAAGQIAKARGKQFSATQRSVLTSAVRAAVSLNHPVYRLFQRRVIASLRGAVHKIILDNVAGGTFTKPGAAVEGTELSAEIVAAAQKSLYAPPLPSFTEQLTRPFAEAKRAVYAAASRSSRSADAAAGPLTSDMCLRLSPLQDIADGIARLCRHNNAVHGSYYVKIAVDLGQSAAAEASRSTSTEV